MQGELRIADDGGQQVVELVGDDRRDGADGGQPLRFGELVAQRLQLLLQGAQLVVERRLKFGLGSGLRITHGK